MDEEEELSEALERFKTERTCGYCGNVLTKNEIEENTGACYCCYVDYQKER